MKRLLILFAILSLPTMLLAQHISVASFRSLPTDMTARVTDPVKDQNGDKCALIKVVTTETDFAWEGGMLGVMKAEKKKGEYWVYVPYGAKKLTIKHDKLGVLRNYLYPEPIEEATVYEMVLAAGKVTTIVSGAQIQKQWLVILSEPAGAAVYINNQLQSSLTPFQKKFDLGKYTYRLEYANYHNEAGAVELDAESKQELNIKLKPAFGSLKVSSTPEGADVMVDGKPTGLKSPCTINELASGQHELRLIKEMYSPFVQQFTIKDGEITELNIPLDANFGMVHIQTDPEADIYIDGDVKGHGEWSGNLSTGQHQAEARLINYYSVSEGFEVNAGDNKTIELKPIPKTGNVDIVTRPLQARIILDGQDYGTTPNTLTHILVGKHNLQLSKEGYGTINKTISIIENQTLEINEELPSGKEITINSEPQGATLTIDGQIHGQTPWTGTLAFGSHDIKLQNETKTVNEQITISQNGQSSFCYDVIGFGKNFTETVNGVSFTMVAIKGGCFQMGQPDPDIGWGGCSNDEQPVHEVCLDDYYIGQTEVTVAQFRLFIDATNYKTDAEKKGYSRIYKYQWKSIDGVTWKDDVNGSPRLEVDYNHPVIHVSWNDAIAYCEWLSQILGKKFRLPTEAEWEYAAKGGASRTSATATYAGSDNIDEVAWYYDNSGGKTHPVAQKKANALGIYDMSGNVYEWCSDWFDSGYYKNSPRNNPQGASSGSKRVNRGGSWHGNARCCRSAYRNSISPGFSGSDLGFRLACSVD